MLTSLFDTQNVPKEEEHREGELYKVVTVFGKTFELWYGYYEDYERENPTVEPMPIYPNFRKEPLYTDEGEPFVTMMQDACPYYKGEKGHHNTHRQTGGCVGKLNGVFTCHSRHRHKAYVNLFNLYRLPVNGCTPTIFIGNREEYKICK